MGRHFEVRAASMAASAAKKSAVYMRASKEIYMAAKSGIPDPESNLALRSAIDKYRKSCPKDVIERAIKKAQGNDSESYNPGRYEAFGPCGTYLVIDTLTDNANRALSDVRTAITKKGGHMGNVAFNFTELGVLVFNGTNRDEVEENLILSDVDVQSVTEEEGTIEVDVTPSAFNDAKKALEDMGVKEFEMAEIRMVPNEYVELTDPEDKERFKDLLDKLDELGDVQEVFHNVGNL